MSLKAKNEARWPALIKKKYEKALQHSKESKAPNSSCVFDISTNTDYTKFDIKLTLQSGIYKGQTHILEFHSKWGSSTDTHYYPYIYPMIVFKTKIYHPNIAFYGGVCLDILKNTSAWSPSYDISTVINSIVLLINTPENSSALNGEAASLHKKCFNKYTELNTYNASVKEIDDIFNNAFKPYINEAKLIAESNTDILLSYSKVFDMPIIDQMTEMKI